MNAPQDALIAKAAAALWDSLLGKHKRSEFAECPEQHLPWWHEQARAVIAVVLDDLHERLRDAIRETSIYDAKITGLLHAAELIGVSDAADPEEADHG